MYAQRQRDYMQSLDAASYLFHLPRYLDELRRSPVIDAALHDLDDELAELGRELVEHDQELTPQVIEARHELQHALPPERDDTDMEPPDVMGDTWGYAQSFANFDAIASGAPFRPRGGGDETTDVSRVGQLILILQQKLADMTHREVPPEHEGGPMRVVEAELTPDLQVTGDRLAALAGRHRYAHQKLVLRRRNSPAVALRELEQFALGLNPEPVGPAETDQELRERLEELLRTADTRALLERVLYMTPSTGLGEQDETALRVLVDEQLRPRVERLHVGLLTQLDHARSYLAVLRRFKARCEWHDRDRMLDIASRARPENALRAELARYLFDQGLSPLTDPLVSDLRPDVFDPSLKPNVWVEAKQYAGGNPKGRIVEWAAQTFNTVRRHIGTAYDVREVFFVIFRRGGRDVDLPLSYRAEQFTVYPLLVDVAPPELSGSRQREQAVMVSSEELAPEPS